MNKKDESLVFESIKRKREESVSTKEGIKMKMLGMVPT